MFLNERKILRYKQAIERNIELESAEAENARRYSECELELRTTRKRLLGDEVPFFATRGFIYC